MKGVLKTIGSILAFILCVGMLIAELTVSLAFSINNLSSDAKIDEMLGKLNMNYMLRDENDNETPAYKRINRVFRDAELTEADEEKIVNSRAFKKLLKLLVVGVKETYLYGEKDVVLTRFGASDLVDSNLDEVLTSLSVSFNLSEREKIYNSTKDELYRVSDDLSSLAKSYHEHSYSKYIKYILDMSTILKLLGVIVLAVVLISVFTWGIGSGLKFSGITTLISSILIIFLGLFVLTVSSYILNNISMFHNYISLLRPIIKEVGLVFISSGLISLGVSIVMLVIANIFIQNKEKRIRQGTLFAS